MSYGVQNRSCNIAKEDNEGNISVGAMDTDAIVTYTLTFRH